MLEVSLERGEDAIKGESILSVNILIYPSKINNMSMSNSTTVDKTLHKEIHPEQVKREQMAEKLDQARQGRLPNNQELSSGVAKAQAGINRNEDQLAVP